MAARPVHDVDPPGGAASARVVDAARLPQRALADSGLGAAVKTSGAKGLHVIVPVRGVTVDDAAAATRALAARAERLDPGAATTALLLEDRGGRVFLDPTRSGGASLPCAFTPRARPGVQAPHVLPAGLVDAARPIPVARVAAVHEGRRRARDRRPDRAAP